MRTFLTATAILLAAPAAAATLTGTVTLVRDGDTIVVDDLPVRLNGLAAPEHDEPGGPEATAAMEGIALGQPVVCELNGEVTYDRVVGVCFVGSEDIAAALIRMGLGRDCPRYSDGRYATLDTDAGRTLPLPEYCEPR